MSEVSSRRWIRYSLSLLVTAKRSSDFLLYKRSEQDLGAVVLLLVVRRGHAHARRLSCIRVYGSRLMVTG